MFFLHEARPYRDLRHPNVLRLVGRCLETDPFLVVLEACSSGDLKSFLSQNISTAEALSQQGVTLLMCCQVAAGLQFMHQHGFVHTDLAARNCLVTSDLTVKIGDYGISIETFKEDYYCTSEVALPIRWCAPETLHCTDTTIETKEVTPCANVWSLGVVLWEICEFGKLPYEDLSDDEVIMKVLVEVSKCLPLPSRPCPHRHNLYHLMKLCWSTAPERPALPQVLAMLNHLYGNREFASIDNDVCSSQADEDFERRWETFKPNTIPVTDNHVITSTDVHRPSSLLGCDPTDMVPPVLITSNLASEMNILNKGSHKSSTQPSHEILVTPQETPFVMSDISPLTTSPQPSLTSSSGGEIFLPSLQQRHKSPSLQNLRGSLDDLSESNGQIQIEEYDCVKQEVNGEKENRNETSPEKSKSESIDTNIPQNSVDPSSVEPDFDSWLQGVETTDEEDAKFVRKISEAIRDLDNALALEKTSSSSSSPASSKSGSHHHTPTKDVTPKASDENVVLDFRLGPTELRNDRFESKSVSLVQPDSLLDDSLMDKSLVRDTNNRATDSGTDTEDETWRKRIECGEFTAKVKEKSKSVADLMVLTHIDCSDGSDSEPPSLTWTFDRGSNSRNSFSKQRRGSSFKGGNLNTNALAFASESNIHQAVLGEEFRSTLLRLHEAQKDQKTRLGSLEMLPLNHETMSEETLTNSADPLLPTSTFLCDADDFENMGLKIDSPSKKDNNFLVDDASEDSAVKSKSTSLEAEADSSADVKNLTSEIKVIDAFDRTEYALSAQNENSKEKTDPESENRNDSSSVTIEKNFCDSDSVICTPELNSYNILQPSDSRQSLPCAKEFQSDCFKTDSSQNLPVPLLFSNDNSANTEESELVVIFSDNKETDFNESVCEEKFAPEIKSSSTPKRNSVQLESGDSIIDPTTHKIEFKKIVDSDGAPENTQEMENSLSNSSLILSNSDSRDATFNSSEVNVNTNVSVQSGISTDSFEFVPVVGSEPKPCSSPTDPLEIEHKEISSATINENMSNSISEGSVILGPCEDYTLDYFKGLKTISKDSGPFLSDDSDHAESANISDSSEEDEPNVVLNCQIVKSCSTVSQTEQESTLVNNVSDIVSQLSESCQPSKSTPTTCPKKESESNHERLSNVCEEKRPDAGDKVPNLDQGSAGLHNTETCLSKIPLISVKEGGRNSMAHTCEKTDVGLQKDCSKTLMNSFAPDSLEKQVFDGHEVSAPLQNFGFSECLSGEVIPEIDSPTETENHSEVVNLVVLEGVLTSAPYFSSNEKEDVLSMDPDSLNEVCRERTLVDTSIDSIEASKEISMSCITTAIDENCGQLVEAETSTNFLSCGMESSEGKSEVSLSISLENEVPTVVASTLGRSSDSNVEYDSSDTLVSLEHSLPEIELQDKTLSTCDNSPSPELFEDKKAVSYAFLQQEVNAENLYRQKPVINTCTLEPVFSQIVLDTSKTISEKDSEIKTEKFVNHDVCHLTEISVNKSSVNIKPASNQPSTSSTDIINDDHYFIKECENPNEQNVKSTEMKEIVVEKEDSEKNDDISLKIKNDTIVETLNNKANSFEVNSSDTQSGVEAECKTISHFTKDVPSEVVPSIYNSEQEKTEPLHTHVSEVNPSLNLEKNEPINSICSSNDHEEYSESKICFNDGSEGFIDQKGSIEKWKQSDVNILNEEFLHSQKPSDHNFLALGLGIDSQDYGPDFHPENDTTVELDDGEDYGLDVAKHSTPDDERSSDSGFRDKGSLSESCEDACDEKYNLEDIEAELEETFNKGGFNYIVKGLSGDEDDLEHHTSSEELPHEHIADHEVSPCEKIELTSDADVSESMSEETIEKKQTNEVNVHPSLSSNSDVMSISEETTTSILNDIKLSFANTEKTVAQNTSPSGTPDLLNIETNDTPMPDVTSPHGTTGNKMYTSVSETNSSENEAAFDNDLKFAMSDGFDVDIQSRFCQEKDMILDIGQTEFRTLSPEGPSPVSVDSGETSPVKKAGWFLHPPAGVEVNDENYDDNLDDVFTSPKSTSSSTSNIEEGSGNENRYELYSLNEEFVAAIRNELQEKLPCARQQNHDDSENDGVLEPEDETSQDERTDITIHYNVYPPPLSPILEERESVSSITTTLSDNLITKGTQQPESDSEPASPVFVLDSVDLVNAEADAKRFEEEIREALENCSLSSADTDSFSDKGQINKSILLEDLEDSREDQPSGQVSDNTNSNNVTVIKSTSPQSEYDDDFLVIDTETNQATLLESPKPKSHLAFIKKQLPTIDAQITESCSHSDVLKNELLVLSSDESTQGLKLEVNADSCMSDDDAFTPDSISPRQDRQILSYDTELTHTENHDSEVTASSSDRSSVSFDSIEVLQSHGIPASYSLYCARNIGNSELQNPTLDVIEKISIGVSNNEAAEIISELENSGIIDKNHKNGDNDSDEPDGGCNTNEDDDSENVIPIELETSTKFTCDDSSRTESDGEESGGISLEESSDSLKSPDRCMMKKSLSLDLSSLKQGTSLKRFQSHDNISENDKSEDKKHHPPIEVTGCDDDDDDDDDEDKEVKSNVRLTDTLDLFKKRKNTQREEGSTDRDWSVTTLETAVLSTKAPMPSPEDESWKQIPSMLAFSDLNEMMSRCSNEEDFAEGYAEVSSPGFPSHENDEDLMSTSFSLKDSEDIGDCYTPDWESEDDTNEEDNNSSSSGEFIWKEGDKEASVKAVDIQTSGGASKPFEGHSEFGMEVIAEEEEEEEDEEEEDDDSMSYESGTEFIPSAWNSEATPNRSALRSPDKKQEQKKNVSFKKQKYHCVYEYPREASDSESEGTDSPSRRRWDLYQPDVDYASYADWELMEGDVAESSGPDIDTDPEVPLSQPTQTFDFYKLSNVDCDFSTGVVSEDGEFYISSSARPFQFSGTSSDLFGGNGSEFFPGQLYHSSNDEDISAPPTEIRDVSLEFLPFEGDTDNRENISKNSEEVGTLSQTLPRVENSDNHTCVKVEVVETQQISLGNLDMPEKESTNRDQEEKFLQTSASSFMKEPDSPGSPLDSSPTSPLSPTSGLGELRHTRDRLKLDLPTSGSTFLLDPPASNKRRSVETIKGEASLLDSGEETEDSGIESSNGTNSSKSSKHAETSLPSLSIMNPGKV